jgi:hypothetical protein
MGLLFQRSITLYCHQRLDLPSGLRLGHPPWNFVLISHFSCACFMSNQSHCPSLYRPFETGHKLWKSLCSFLPTTVTSSLQSPNISYPTFSVRFHAMHPSLQLRTGNASKSHCTTLQLHTDHQSSSMHSTSFIPFQFADFINAFFLPHCIKTVTQNIP